jgi:hypothetical protein
MRENSRLREMRRPSAPAGPLLQWELLTVHYSRLPFRGCSFPTACPPAVVGSLIELPEWLTWRGIMIDGE